MSLTKEDYNEESGDENHPKKTSEKSKSLRANGLILMQKELLSDMSHTLKEIQSVSNISKSLLISYRSSAETDLENANKYNKNILGSTRLTDEEIEEYTKSRINKKIKDIFCHIIAEINERLGIYDENQTSSNTSSKDSDNIRLPPLDIPTFSGKYDERLPFNNLFTSSVHNKSNLDPVQKLQYLMQAVTGDAYQQIKNLSLTNENYEKAREILEEQYNHTRKVAHTYMKKLLDIKPMQTENAKDLRNFISNTKDCLILLKSLKLPTETWDYILLYNLQSKIPSSTFFKWEEELG